MIMVLVAALAIQAQSPAANPSQPNQAQAEGQAAIESMTMIFRVMGSCERHFTPEQVQGVRRGIEPQAGQAPTPLQAHLDRAYQAGKADESWTAPMCQEAMRSLSEAKQGS